MEHDAIMTMVIKLSAMILAIVWSTVSPSFGDITGQVRVIDGDTLELAGQKIRLHGIDAPETKQLCQTKPNQPNPCGQLATKALTEVIAGKIITCQGHDHDRYGRLIGTCFRAGIDINRHMVLNGWALAYRAYSHDYVDAENSARKAGVGIWKGKFVPPWEWRRGKRLIEHAKTEVGACKIKANVNSKGQRIYHMPGDQFYDAVKIRPEQGDQCFDTGIKAEAAGFRRSSR